MPLRAWTDTLTPRWVLRSPRPSPGRLRLFCLPYAGGGAAAYRAWADGLPPEIEVCRIELPGRGSRFAEPRFKSAAELVRAAADGLRPHLDPPFALFGHSMGALLAFELARELRRRGRPLPALLLVAGHEAPQCPDPDPPLSHLPDSEFVEEIRRRYDGIPAEVLAEPELLDLLLPVLRDDVALLERYRYSEEPPLDCPISCLGGEEDRRVSRESLEAWRDQTVRSFALRLIPGGHFFIESARAAVLRAVGEDLEPWTSAARP